MAARIERIWAAPIGPTEANTSAAVTTDNAKRMAAASAIHRPAVRVDMERGAYDARGDTLENTCRIRPTSSPRPKEPGRAYWCCLRGGASRHRSAAGPTP